VILRHVATRSYASGLVQSEYDVVRDAHIAGTLRD
jgi:hypothetical protein